MLPTTCLWKVVGNSILTDLKDMDWYLLSTERTTESPLNFHNPRLKVHLKILDTSLDIIIFRIHMYVHPPLA